MIMEEGFLWEVSEEGRKNHLVSRDSIGGEGCDAILHVWLIEELSIPIITHLSHPRAFSE